MKRFMIGQFGSYSQEKQHRDFRDNFFGVEACLLDNQYSIDKLIYEAKKGGFHIGVHFPLRTGGWKLRDPQFLSKDDEIRKRSYLYMKEEISFLQEIKPYYVLFHYPKPVILDDTADWSKWRFADDTEYCFESEYSYEVLQEKSEELFQWLTKMSSEYNFIPVLELDALNRYIYDSNLLETLLEKYPLIKLCLDIGRLHLQDKIDDNFDSYDITKRFAKYAEVIHLWNVKVSNNLENGHFPVLPDLDPDEGWADTEKYLKIIRQENKTCKILFEHRSDLITDEELESCYSWVNRILSEHGND